MSYYGLDKEFNIITHLEPYNVQWNRKYYETGDFEIYIDIEQYSSNIKYIYSTDDKELGIVDIPHYSASNNTKQMLLKGSFFESLLYQLWIHHIYIPYSKCNICPIISLQHQQSFHYLRM